MKNGILGILYRTSAPKFAVDNPTENEKKITKMNEKINKGLEKIVLKNRIGPSLKKTRKVRNNKMVFSIADINIIGFRTSHKKGR
jgi:hypothetical protein